ncbi:uncharacterized protein VDAG_04859 [Verticillium dahliae VdLs.17]|uniref:Uncharacterized protein n=1 Tax=Verticillium dahliae (strain VdLs.17 / ATCC MYA-4575 / FGSC 10137) TaxID=498257 RepID=G2X374_VERDV|nr:uncharacterized protein VDAG_04859 [Verticillium dahliae VdLs.17]EGY23421.1 hypothetical protein VDAG_04859 [Verticillium dahliae VdLs.17]
MAKMYESCRRDADQRCRTSMKEVREGMFLWRCEKCSEMVFDCGLGIWANEFERIKQHLKTYDLCLGKLYKDPVVLQTHDWFLVEDGKIGILLILHQTPIGQIIERRSSPEPPMTVSQSTADQAGDFHFVGPGGEFLPSPKESTVYLVAFEVAKDERDRTN